MLVAPHTQWIIAGSLAGVGLLLGVVGAASEKKLPWIVGGGTTVVCAIVTLVLFGTKDPIYVFTGTKDKIAQERYLLWGMTTIDGEGGEVITVGDNGQRGTWLVNASSGTLRVESAQYGGSRRTSNLGSGTDEIRPGSFLVWQGSIDEVGPGLALPNVVKSSHSMASRTIVTW